MSNLLMFLPDEATPIILVLLLVGVVAGFVRFRILLGFVLLVAFTPLLGELFDLLLQAIPWWLVLLTVGGIVMWVVRSAMALLIGSEAASHAVGALAAEAVKLCFKALLLPFRLCGWLYRRRHV